MNREILLFVDTETTGLDPDRHSVIEIGAIAYENGSKIDEFQGTCKPYRNEITFGALNTNRVAPSKLDNLGDSNILATKFSEFLLGFKKSRYDQVIIGEHSHGNDFDYNYLDNFLKFHNFSDFKSYVSNETINTKRLAETFKRAGLIDVDKLHLDKLAKSLDISYNSDKHHTALYDAELAAQCYFKLIDIVQEKAGIKISRKWS